MFTKWLYVALTGERSMRNACALTNARNINLLMTIAFFAIIIAVGVLTIKWCMKIQNKHNDIQ